jgi:hypothetical protein
MVNALRRLVLAPFVIPGFSILFLAIFSLVYWMGIGSSRPEDRERRDVFKEALRGRRIEAVLGLLLGLVIGGFAIFTSATIIANFGNLPIDRLLGCAAVVFAVALLPPAGSWFEATLNATGDRDLFEVGHREALPQTSFTGEREEQGKRRGKGKETVA